MKLLLLHRTALLGLLATEALLFFSQFDARQFGEARQCWEQSELGMHLAGAMAVGVVAALLLCGNEKLLRAIGQIAAHSPRYRKSWLLLGHLAGALAFFMLTRLVISEELHHARRPLALLFLWASTGLASVLFWLAAGVAFNRHSLQSHPVWYALGSGMVFGFVGFCVGRFTMRYLWVGVGGPTVWATRHLLGIFCPEVVYKSETATLGTPAFTAVIAPSCIGYEGMGLMILFFGGYVWLFWKELRLQRALLLLPVAIALMWLANVLRLVVLILIGTWLSPELAMEGFHAQAGWLGFLAVSLGLVAATLRPKSVPEPTAHMTSVSFNPTLAYLAPLFVLLVTAMVTSAFSIGLDSLYPLCALAGAAALWSFRGEYAGWIRNWSWEAIVFGLAVVPIWVALVPNAPQTAESMRTSLEAWPRAWAAAWLVLRVIGYVVVTPLAEELAFRGFLMRKLIGREFENVPMGEFSWFSLLVSAALFGLAHHDWLPGMAAGIIYSLALYRRKQLADAVVAHATSNAGLAAYVFMTGNWSLMS